jgi:hypothetical protein
VDARVATKPKSLPARFQQTPNDVRSVHRALTAIALSGPWRTSAERIVQKSFPDDTTALYMVRAATTPASTTSFPAFTASTLLPAIAPTSAAVRLFNAAFSVNLDGITSVTLPGIKRATPIRLSGLPHLKNRCEGSLGGLEGFSGLSPTPVL